MIRLSRVTEAHSRLKLSHLDSVNVHTEANLSIINESISCIDYRTILCLRDYFGQVSIRFKTGLQRFNSIKLLSGIINGNKLETINANVSYIQDLIVKQLDHSEIKEILSNVKTVANSLTFVENNILKNSTLSLSMFETSLSYTAVTFEKVIDNKTLILNHEKFIECLEQYHNLLVKFLRGENIVNIYPVSETPIELKDRTIKRLEIIKREKIEKLAEILKKKRKKRITVKTDIKNVTLTGVLTNNNFTPVNFYAKEKSVIYNPYPQKPKSATIISSLSDEPIYFLPFPIKLNKCINRMIEKLLRK